MTERRKDLVIAIALGVATFIVMLLTERAIGFTRDESFYFYAADQYTPWYLGIWDALIHGRIAEHFSDATLRRAFSYNTEHPVLMKTLFGLSHSLFTVKLDWLRPAAGYRAPAWAISGLIASLLYLFGKDASGGRREVGILAALLFWCCPHNLYHGHLACFDMPITGMWLLFVYAYWRGFTSRRWAIFSGVAYGLALATKLNAFFYPASLLAHWLVAIVPGAWRAGRWKGLRQTLPKQWGWMAALGPVVFFLHWPYLWPHPFLRLGSYLGFHADHVNYPWAYLNQLLRDPPFPWAYVVVVTALTVPLPIFALFCTGTLRALSRLFARGEQHLDSLHVLLLFNGLFPLMLISWPTVPHFGGIKHWMPGLPYLAVLGAEALVTVAATLAAWLRRRELALPLTYALGALVLLPGVIGAVHIGGYGESFYNELAGGGAGGAELGMERQFWSNNVSSVLDWLNHDAPQNAAVDFHEVTQGSYEAYRQNGMLRPDIRFTLSPQNAQLAAYQYMQEFRDQEYQIWNSFGTNEPVDGHYLDEAPDITVYARPGQ
jgi:4-amino-4-deoxy-L-arabinose transferase-like glycosyltransferase